MGSTTGSLVTNLLWSKLKAFRLIIYITDACISKIFSFALKFGG